jgi:hypothetical protein|nr:MAG TPA: hypothetical protein [Caudoviricetes sp.]
MGNNINRLLECLAKTGVCQTGKRYLNGTNKDLETLIKVWRGWPEYWYEHSEATIKLLRMFLTDQDKKTLAENFLFVDFFGEFRLNREFSEPIFIVGSSNVVINMPAYMVGKSYLFNEAKAMFNVSENAIFNIETFDTSHIEINNPQGKCTIYRYDQSIVSGTARVIDKEYIRGNVFNGKEFQPKTF